VDLYEHADLLARKPRDERHLPQWPRPDVVGEIEGLIVDPHRPAEPASRHAKYLAKTRDEMQAGSDRMPDSLDPEAAVRIEQARAVEDDKSTVLLRPDRVRLEHDLVLG